MIDREPTVAPRSTGNYFYTIQFDSSSTNLQIVQMVDLNPSTGSYVGLRVLVVVVDLDPLSYSYTTRKKSSAALFLRSN